MLFGKIWKNKENRYRYRYRYRYTNTNNCLKMTTSSTFQKVNDLFQCKLVLENGTEFVIPLREDGYIFATKLCQAAGKRLTRWKNSNETKDLIKKISLTKNETTEIVEVYQGGNKYSQGTWIHPDLGINLAQWCSPNFALQISRWMKELIFTGSVEIGKEKSHDDIIKQLQKQLEFPHQLFTIHKIQQIKNEFLQSFFIKWDT